MFRIGLLLTAAVLVSCSARDISPEAVCTHATDLATTDAEEASAELGAMAEAANGLAQIAIQAAGSVCPTVLAQMKGSDEDSYKVTANCVLDSSDIQTVKECLPDVF